MRVKVSYKFLNEALQLPNLYVSQPGIPPFLLYSLCSNLTGLLSVPKHPKPIPVSGPLHVLSLYLECLLPNLHVCLLQITQVPAKMLCSQPSLIKL